MKSFIRFALALLLLSTLNSQLSTCSAQGTAFTYQGRLNSGSAVASGIYDLRFAIYDAVSSGAQQGVLLTNAATSVSNGLFAVTLDFGNQFPGANRWLEIAVRTNGAASFTLLAPRQALTPSPYAVFANTASNLSGALPLAQLPASVVTNNAAGLNLTGTFTGNGASVTNVNAALLNGLAASNFWQLGGNNISAAQFLGSTNNQPLELRVNSRRVARYELATNSLTQSNGVNLVAGSPNNFIGAGLIGATIGGGGALTFGGAAATNSVATDFGTIAGGSGNVIRTDSRHSAVGGGQGNLVNGAWHTTIAGGSGNTVWLFADGAVIGGGYGNFIDTSSTKAVIAGGEFNDLGTNSGFSVISGGRANVIGNSATNSVVAGGADNLIGTNTSFSAIGGGQQNIIDGAWQAVIAGGLNNQINDFADGSAIGGGRNNFIGDSSTYAAIAGGRDNFIGLNTLNAVIAGGFFNTIASNAANAFIGGGTNNLITANGQFGMIPGGQNNSATNFAFAAGRNASALHTGALVWSDGTGTATASGAANSVTMRGSGGFRFFTGTGAAGAQLAAGATAWSVLSDRNLKKDFAAVDNLSILEKLAALPITQWHYQWEGKNLTPHIGPMAQDFKAAFYPGRDDKTISTLEADGVAFAAIQGLNEKVESGKLKAESQIEKLVADNAELKAQLHELKVLINQLAEGKQK